MGGRHYQVVSHPRRLRTLPHDPDCDLVSANESSVPSAPCGGDQCKQTGCIDGCIMRVSEFHQKWLTIKSEGGCEYI